MTKKTIKENTTVKNKMTMTVWSKTVNEALVRGAVSAFCAELDPNVDQINDIKTALSEALNNAIVHGYSGKEDCPVYITAMLDSDTVYITVQDNGCGIEDIDKAMQPFFSTKPDQERSGMGFTIMETYTDKLTVTSDKNGTTVTMQKKIE